MKNATFNKKHALPKVITRDQLAQIMGIHVNTLRNRLRKKGMELPSGSLFPEQVAEICTLLGYPKEMVFETLGMKL